ncbi:MAG: hypothetical protein OEY89_12225 [Gammaproteobacteria bacterium]|nr:hypothetical protein [Gammaproteobacteria bacterium]
MSISESINNAARDLPEGWQVAVIVELHGYSVKLMAPTGLEVEFNEGEPSIEDEITEAVQMAIFTNSANKTKGT